MNRIFVYYLVVVFCILHPWCVYASTPSGESTNGQSGRRNTPESGGDSVPVVSPRGKDYYEESIVYTTLAGNIIPFLKRFLISRQDLRRVWHTISQKAHLEDMMLMAVVGWFTVPFTQLFYKAFYEGADKKEQLKMSSEKLPRSRGYVINEPPDFQSTSMYVFSDHIQQIAKIGLAVYIVDVMKILLVSLGIHLFGKRNVPHAFAQVAYVIWFGQRMAVAKKHGLRRYVSRHPETYGHMKTINRLLNAAIISATAFVVLNILKVEMGVAINSFLALGSVGTLALGLASQGITTQVLSGLMLVSSDRIYEGDVVRFGNGLLGTITQIGWMETVIRSSDEVEVCVPHTDLIKQQLGNLSRVRYSQVHQVLRFRYSDAEKLPDVIASIQNEIYAACPSLITDGTRPFRVYWSNYGVDALEVTVEAHFRVRTLSDEYYDNRERVLMAIRRAVRRHDVYFAKEDKPVAPTVRSLNL